MLAAVVRPLTVSPWRTMAPPPRNPIPVTIWAARRLGSVPMPLPNP
ncbi:MAG: hypothetical protein K0S88_2367 [Actinomycetia bacterium]|nr:hypothetical protein [Actinomycetes bacterium]